MSDGELCRPISPPSIPESEPTSPAAARAAFTPSRSPSKSSASFKNAAAKLSSVRSLLSASTSLSPTNASGRSTPVKIEMSVTEQIARKTRKSTVLDEKNALLIMAIPDYDDYKIMQPYSCRTLTNRSKFVGGRDFITRHNPQEVNDFKKQFSREVGNLNRHRSVVSPPGSTLAAAGLLAGTSSSSLSIDSPSTSAALSKLGNNNRRVWKKAFTASQKTCWVLTEFGVESLIGPEYRMTTRLPVLPPEKQPSSPSRATTSYSYRRPTSRADSLPLSASNGSETARIGSRVDLLDEKTLAGLSRTAAYSPLSRPPTSPLRSPSRSGHFELARTSASPIEDRLDATQQRLCYSAPVYFDLLDEPLSPALSPPQTPSRPALRLDDRLRSPLATAAASTAQTDASPTARPFAMEVVPPVISLGTLQAGEVYLFPVRVRNVGFMQERFRAKKVVATCAGFDAALAEATFDKDAARLAPGLAGIVTLALSFRVPGRATGFLRLETEGAGECEVPIKAEVR